ncbi:MAG TPA: DUF2085 domain-containing protein [Terriglobales bacterium]|nr:DUF2085 domain-containing protein [Terriglobales bacterium]
MNADLWWKFLPASLALAAVAAPLLGGHPLAAWTIREFFSRVCHQEAERSFWLWGAPVAVCARCLGIYLGAAVGGWLRWQRRAAVRFLTVAAAVNGLDVVTEMAGLHGNWMDARFMFGLALGIGMAAVVAAGSLGSPSLALRASSGD